MSLHLPRRAVPFILFTLVVFAVYGYGIHVVVDATNHGASQRKLLLLALMIAGAIGSIFFGFSRMLLLRHRFAVRRIEREFTAKTGLTLARPR